MATTTTTTTNKCLNCLNIITIEGEQQCNTTSIIANQETISDTIKYIFNLQLSSSSTTITTNNNDGKSSVIIRDFVHQVKYGRNPTLCNTCGPLLKQLIELRGQFKNLAHPKSIMVMTLENKHSQNPNKSRLDSDRKHDNQLSVQTVASSTSSRVPISNNNIKPLITESIEKDKLCHLAGRYIMEGIYASKGKGLTLSGIADHISTKRPQFIKNLNGKNCSIDEVAQNTKLFIQEPEANPTGITQDNDNSLKTSHWKLNPLVRNLHCSCCSRTSSVANKNTENPRVVTSTVNNESIQSQTTKETKKLQESNTGEVQWKSVKDNNEEIAEQSRHKISISSSSPPKRRKLDTDTPNTIKIKPEKDSKVLLNHNNVIPFLSTFESQSNEIMEMLSKVNSNKANQFKLTTIDAVLKIITNMYLHIQEIQHEIIASSSLLSKQQEMTVMQNPKLRLPQIDVLAKYFILLIQVINLIESNSNSKLEIAMEIIKLRLTRLIKFFTNNSNYNNYNTTKNGKGNLLEAAVTSNVTNVKIIDSYFTNICTCVSRKEFRIEMQNHNNNGGGLLLDDWSTMKALNIWDRLIKEKTLLNNDPVAIELDHNHIGLSGFQKKIEKLFHLCLLP